MISRIHSKLGTAGFIVAIVALVAALSGAAIAAQQGLNPKQKKEVTKIAKKYAGKPGPQGPQGLPGAPGAKGDTGAAGANGTDGTDGNDGNSVVVTPEPKGVNCEAGGVEVTVENTEGEDFVCNGTFGESTMTGAWGIGTVLGASESGPVLAESRPVVISFPGALASKPTVVWMKKGEGESYFGDKTKCTGTAAAPTAAAGFLCVYTAQIDKHFTEVGNPIDPDGFVGDSAEVTKFGMVNFLVTETFGYAQGTWAVTPS